MHFDIFHKVHIFWEGQKKLRNLHQLFVLCTASQIIGGDFLKFCGLLRIYELYKMHSGLAVVRQFIVAYVLWHSVCIDATTVSSTNDKIRASLASQNTMQQKIFWSRIYLFIRKSKRCDENSETCTYFPQSLLNGIYVYWLETGIISKKAQNF